MDKVYMCIDLKSFYASVECRERNLDPLTTNLVVADRSRTEKTICLAVSPSLKRYGLSGRSRLFEVTSKIREVNLERRKKISGKFKSKSVDSTKIDNDPYTEVDFIAAPPRMAYYMKYSNDIYQIYLKYLSQNDIYVYSIDEVFCDITDYLNYYKKTPEELVSMIIMDVYKNTGITATAGIGTNLYLAKIAMDIVAKHSEPNDIGVRIAYLDEKLYKEKLWTHKPLTDFWRFGRGTAKRLEAYNMYTMGDIARKSLNDQEFFFKLFGIQAELLIDHAWGYEPVTMDHIKAFKPSTTSISSGQVLHRPYKYNETITIIKEMCDDLSLQLSSKGYVTDEVTFMIGYDIENKNYDGEITIDRYGRETPKGLRGIVHLPRKTNSYSVIMGSVIRKFEDISNKKLLVRRVTLNANNLIKKEDVIEHKETYQLDLFSDNDKEYQERSKSKSYSKQDEEVQDVLLSIKNKYGKNAIVKGMNFESGATMMDRNNQIGGHRA